MFPISGDQVRQQPGRWIFRLVSNPQDKSSNQRSSKSHHLNDGIEPRARFAALSSACIMGGCLNVTEAVDSNYDALEMRIRIICQFAYNCTVDV